MAKTVKNVLAPNWEALFYGRHVFTAQPHR